MADKTDLEQSFHRLESDFVRVRRLYLSRKLTQQEFVAELKKLRVQDETGRYWTLGAQSGKWYYFDGQNWVRADPPASEFTLSGKNSEIPPISYRAQTKANEAAGSEEAAGRKKQILGAPEIAALRTDYSLEVLSSEQERLVLASLPLIPTAFFSGGLVTLLGVVTGAVIGSTSFFLGKLRFLPSFLQEIQGKLTGGFVFAGIGGLGGLFSGVILGLLVAMFFNLSSSLTGGLVIKVRRKKEERTS